MVILCVVVHTGGAAEIHEQGVEFAYGWIAFTLLLQEGLLRNYSRYS